MTLIVWAQCSSFFQAVLGTIMHALSLCLSQSIQSVSDSSAHGCNGKFILDDIHRASRGSFE